MSDPQSSSSSQRPRAPDGAPATPEGPRRRGRPSRAQGPAVTREAIVAAGLQSLRNNGLPGLALREVGRRLGVSLASIQHHFPTRDALWRACVDQLFDSAQPPLPDRPHPVPGAGLVDYLHWQIERATLAPGPTAAMWHDPEEGAEERMRYLAGRSAPRVQAGRRLVEQGVADGALRSVDPDVVLAILGLGVSSLANSPEALRHLFGIDLSDAATRERFTEQLADVLLNGLLADPAARGTTST